MGRKAREGATATLEPPQDVPQEGAVPAAIPISPSEGSLQPEAPPPNGHKHLPCFKVGPIASDRNNSVSAAVWANQIDAKDGRSFTVYNVTFEATWRDADGSWKATKSYRGSMLYVLMHCISRCNEWILSQRDPQAEIPF